MMHLVISLAISEIRNPAFFSKYQVQDVSPAADLPPGLR